MAYTDPLRLIFKGDRAKCARYVNDARRLVFKLVRELLEGGADSGRRLHRFMDGTLVEIVVAMQQVTVTITVPGEEDEERVLNDVVVWARSESFLAGIDPDYPQQILNPPKREGGTWKTYFYDTGITGYDAFPGRKGTYNPPFPGGLRRAGNIDWYNEDDEVISWYGPSSRYWPDAYALPRAQFGKFVFMLGEAILDTDAYALESDAQTHGSDRYVTGAALKRISGVTWLYTVQSEALDEPVTSTTSTILDFPTYGCPYTRQDNAGGIYRYRLTRAPDEQGVSRYTVQPNSRELVVALPDNHCEPWFFNQSCTRAHCYALPTDGWYRHMRWWGTDDAPGLPYHAPDPTQVFREAAFDDLGAGTVTDTSLTVTPSGEPVQVASDYKGDVLVHATVANLTSTQYTGAETRYGSVHWNAAGLSFRCGGGTRTQLAGDPIPPNNDGWLMSNIMFMDLRSDLLVLLTHYQALIYGQKRIEVYRNGVRVHEERATPDDNPVYTQLGFPSGIAEWAGMPGPPTADAWLSLPPYWFVYGIMFFLGYNTVPAPENPPETWEVEFYAAGVNPGFAWAPYIAEAYFGVSPAWLSLPLGWGSNMPLVATCAPEGFQGNAGDFDGMGPVFNAVCKDNLVVMSGWRPASNSPSDPGAWDGNYSFHFAQGGELPVLTGVTGTYTRFHPLWRLGRPAGGTPVAT